MKRGSALLIVLGMVAFMTISAIAFAAFMRSSRLPSSFLRRTSSSRLLAKAALAEAIDEIDIAIGNDLYPGMGLRGREYLGTRTTAGSASLPYGRRNYWRKGCFISTNELVFASNTVSTLTLEGLAYLPPYMINEARFYSRHTPTAQWKTLPFDTGRYAFSAYDVSDCFDINRISANVGRNSSDNGRISLAYLFENVTHDGYDATCKPVDWEKFMNFYVDAANASADGNAGRMPSSANTLPLVSLADYSLAARQNLTAYPNPFCDYVEDGQDFVTSVGGIVGQRLRNQMFVTDSYLPKSPVEAKVHDDYDLNDHDSQPFSLSDLSTRNVPIRTAIEYGSKGANRLKSKNWLCDVGLAALWDYLDVDSIPISLAVPTTERTPMICGLEVKVGNGKLQLVETKEAPGGGVADVFLDEKNSANPATVVSYNDGKTEAESLDRTVSQKATYKLDTEKFGAFFNGLFVNALTVYPFRRIENDKNYVIGGRLAFYFTEKVAKGFHTETDNDVLHLGSDAWKYVIENNNKKPTYNENLGVFYVSLQEKSMTIPTTMATEADAVRKYELEADGDENVEAAFSTALEKFPMFTVTRSWQQTRKYDQNTGTYTSWTPKEPPTTGADKATTVAAECKIPPLTVGFATDQKYSDAKEFLKIVDTRKNVVDVIPQLSFWVYIKEMESGKYVDLVPACVMDDDDLNQIPNYDSWGPDANAFGMPYPLMNFYGTKFSYDPNAMTDSTRTDDLNFIKGVDFGISSAVLFCPDPRWNWAPEHWIKPKSASLDAKTWLDNYSYRGDNSQKNNDPRLGRDRDIFMETSDAGYLQSVYELAFLPRLTDTNPVRCNDPAWGNMTALDGVGRTDFATSFDGSEDGGLAVVNGEFMWRTYRPFPYYKDDDPDQEVVATADDFESIGVSTIGTSGFTSIGSGYRVNPYASTNALMAAFANTPFSWYVASTNSAGGAKITASQRNVDDFNLNYTFSGHNNIEDSTFLWEDLFKIAHNLYVGIHEIDIEKTSAIQTEKAAVELIDKWKDVYDDLDWAGTRFGTAQKFADVTLNVIPSDAQASNIRTCDLSDADKRFLYGYWRECFAPRQQLFLVFVRAEPLMMGGGSANSAPPQLGARAVALVWRDPMPTIEDVSGGQPRPHRTRVLFYRQFE